MKKLFIAICLMAGIAGTATAQQATQKAPVKKDGTPDKRYKANKKN